MAASAPIAASAIPTVTTIQQASNSVEATFANTFGQSVSSDATFQTLSVAVTGVGAAITDAFDLNATLATVLVGGTGGVTLGSITNPSAAAGGTANGALLQITGATAGAAATALSVTNTVFAVDSIKATQSVIDSTSTTLF